MNIVRNLACQNFMLAAISTFQDGYLKSVWDSLDQLEQPRSQTAHQLRIEVSERAGLGVIADSASTFS